MSEKQGTFSCCIEQEHLTTPGQSLSREALVLHFLLSSVVGLSLLGLLFWFVNCKGAGLVGERMEEMHSRLHGSSFLFSY